MPTLVKARYFELVRDGMKGAAAARDVGVSTSCGSLWLVDAARAEADADSGAEVRLVGADAVGADFPGGRRASVALGGGALGAFLFVVGRRMGFVVARRGVAGRLGVAVTPGESGRVGAVVLAMLFAA